MLAEWVARRAPRAAWVACDERDNDPRHLVRSVLAGLRRGFPEVAAAVEPPLAAGDDLTTSILPRFADAVARRGRCVIVLDDLHRVDDPAALTFLRQAIDSVPGNVRVVIATRTWPAIGLSRRCVSGVAATIGTSELAFATDETAQLLNRRFGLGLALGDVAAIQRAAAGWPAAIALVGSTLSGSAELRAPEELLSVARSQLARYVEEEVLDHLRPDLRRFLRRTAILRELTVPACEAVTENPCAGELFAELRREELLVAPVDDDRLRCHEPLRRVLLRDLREREHRLLPELHRRASAWATRRGRIGDAIRHASAAGDGPRAAELLADHWPSLLEGGADELRGLLRALPPDHGRYATAVQAAELVCLATEGADVRLLHERHAALRTHADEPGVRPLVDYLRANPFCGDVGRAAQDGMTILERYAGEPIEHPLAIHVAIACWLVGDSAALRRVLEPRLAILGHAHRPLALALLSLAATDEDDHAGAARLADAALRERGPSLRVLGDACPLPLVTSALSLRQRGELERADQALMRAHRATRQVPGSLRHGVVLIAEAELALELGDADRASSAAQAARRVIDCCADAGRLTEWLCAVESALRPEGVDELLGTPPTAAEMRVLRELPTELTLKEIADELFLSLNTVRSHVRRLYRRLGASSRPEAVAIARERGHL